MSNATTSRLIDGYYLTADLNDAGDLVWSLTDEGRTELADLRESHPDAGDDWLFFELAEDFLANGWEAIPPEDVGALTDATIISDECERTDAGDVVRVGRAWWDANYAVRSTVGELENGNTVVWPAGDRGPFSGYGK